MQTDNKSCPKAPRNGISLKTHLQPAAVVAGISSNRDITEITRGCPGRTLTLPPSVRTVRENALCHGRELRSVRLNPGLETLGNHCFEDVGIRHLTLPESVRNVGASAFANCRHLECADLRPSLGLNYLDEHAFANCE